MCIAGLTTQQRQIWMKKKGISHSGEHAWISKGSLNSLAYVYKLHCGKQLSKEPRDIFVKGTILDVANDFQVSFLIHCTNWFV